MPKSKNSFGQLGENKDLAIQPETTGVIMQVEGLVAKNIASVRDVEMLEEIQEDSKKEEHEFIEPEIQIDSLGKNINSSTVEEQIATTLRDLPFEPEAIIGSSDILPVWFLEVGAQRANAVCKVETSGVDYKGRRGNWRGTGFMVSENILLTNHHVLNSQNVCENAMCVFNYQMNEAGKMQETQTFQLKPSRLFITSPADDLDFTFCWVEGFPGKKFSYLSLHRHSFVAKNGDCANIIQHPNGEPKSVVVQKNEITNQDEIVIHYMSDTLPGSSGGLVANNEWKPFALHHATRETKKADLAEAIPAQYINEGIKLSAIATYLETISSPDEKSAATEVLNAFSGTDVMLGYFGSLGRSRFDAGNSSDFESVVDAYTGEAKDVDIAFWNIEWFNKNYTTKIEEVAKIIVRMNLDVWCFEESSPEATQKLSEHLKSRYQLDYGYAASEPNASSEKQTTTIIWNRKTVTIESREWPERIKKWFQLKSNNIDNPDDLVLELDSDLIFESIDGKIFDRYPGLFYLKSINRGDGREFDSYIVPLHLKAMAEGSKRRELASRILTVAVQTMINEHDADKDWILGGDMNATLASEDFNYLIDGKFIALSAEDERKQAITYIKGKYKSLIDHIFLSPNLAKIVDSSNFFIVANDKTLPDYLSISDHRPVLMRLSLKDFVNDAAANSPNSQSFSDTQLLSNLTRLKDRPNKHSNFSVTDTFDALTAINLLKSNQERDYYNAEEDVIAIRKYYGAFPNNLDGQQFYKYLNQLLSRTHTKQLPYKPAQYLYTWVDLQEDKVTLQNIYSGEQNAAETLIEADFVAENKRFEKLKENYPNLDCETENSSSTDLILERFESDFPVNCEHVVPQSWFSKANPMRGDLHHLFACTPNCNSFRSNIPYYEYPDWEEKVMDECGLRDTKGFEPKNGKGAVARATLYFLLRYPKLISKYSSQDLVSLITWHINEPPSIYEKHRNVAIQELQGNRNPLIDFPKIAAKVNFSLGLK